MQGTNWRSTSVLDFVAHVLGAQSKLTEQEKEDLRKTLKLDGVKCLTKNNADSIATELKSSALWDDKPSKLTAEAIDWLEAKQTQLEAGIPDADVEDTDSFELHFKHCNTPNERGQLALTIQPYSLEDIFKKARSGKIISYVNQFAKCAAQYANAGLDFTALLEGGLGCTDGALPVEVTGEIDKFFVQFMVRSGNSYVSLSDAMNTCVCISKGSTHLETLACCESPSIKNTNRSGFSLCPSTH
jgi:hypothetical protein